MSKLELIKIRNNSFIIIFSQIISLALNIISISLAARYLGVEQFGKFNYLLALVGIGAKIIDFGFNPIIFRELSKENNMGKFLGTVFIFRSALILVVVILFSLLSFLLNLTLVEIFLIAMLSFNILFSNKFTNIRELFVIPFKVELNMYIPMVLIILDNVLLLILILLMPYFNGGISYFVIIYLVSNIPGMVILFYFFVKKYNFQIKFNFVELKYLFNESLPLMGFIVLAFLYTQIDILLLENITGSSSVGIYSSALRLIIPLKLIPNVLVITLFSLIVKNVKNKNYNEQIVKFTTKLFFLFSIVFSAFMFVGSEEVILLIFGNEYLEAALPLKILSFGIFFDFFSFFILDLFTAYNKQKYNFQFILLVTLIVLIANIILIPSLDFVGSSLARIISGIFGFMFLLFILSKEIKISVSFVTIRLLFAVSIFMISIHLLSNIYPFINIFVSGIVFIISIIILKIFTVNEVKIILQFINNEKVISIVNRYYKL